MLKKFSYNHYNHLLLEIHFKINGFDFTVEKIIKIIASFKIGYLGLFNYIVNFES